MRLRSTDHQAHPWRIHDLAPEFEVEDVWISPRWIRRLEREWVS